MFGAGDDAAIYGGDKEGRNRGYFGEVQLRAAGRLAHPLEDVETAIVPQHIVGHLQLRHQIPVDYPTPQVQ